MTAAVLKAFDTFKLRACDAWMLEYPELMEELRCQALAFPSYALPTVDPVVLCGVVHRFGEGEVWMVTGEGFEKKVREVLPQQRALIETMYGILGLHRLQMTIDSSRRDAATWAKHLGFEFEHGPMKRKGARAIDMDLYVYNKGEKIA